VSGQQHSPAALYPRKRPGTHFTAGWVGNRAGLLGAETYTFRMPEKSWGRIVAYTGFWWGTHGGKRPHGRLRRRWEYNIEMYLQGVVCGCMDWIELAEDRDRWRAPVKVVMNLRVP